MKKELLIPILILALTIAFAVVSAMVFINGGKSEKLIRRKLKLATLLLTFNAMIWGAKAQDGEFYDVPLLYGAPQAKNYLGIEISLNHNSGKDLVLNKLSKEPIATYNQLKILLSTDILMTAIS